MQDFFENMDLMGPANEKRRAPSKQAACFYISYVENVLGDHIQRFKKCVNKKEITTFLRENTKVFVGEPIIIKGVELPIEKIETYRIK